MVIGGGDDQGPGSVEILRVPGLELNFPTRAVSKGLNPGCCAQADDMDLGMGEGQFFGSSGTNDPAPDDQTRAVFNVNENG